MRRLALVPVLVCACLVLAPVALGDTEVHPPGSDPLGRSYGEWGARLWQWALGGSESENPIINQADCSVAQPEPNNVWYLIGGSEEGQESSCSIPASASLLISPSAAECSELEDGLTEEADLRQCAEDLADGFTVAELIVDGQEIDTDGFRVTTPLFTYTAPANNLFGPDPVSSPMVGSMWILMLKPLSPGQHTVSLTSLVPDEFSASITYEITVLPDTATAVANPQPEPAVSFNMLLLAVVGALATVVLYARMRVARPTQ
jgi:hypothetical protein